MATLLFLLILAVCLEACTANTTSSGLKALACSAGNFTAGDNAVVTCHLPTDVNATMHHVYITWYSFNTTDVYKDVITCFRRRNGLLKCDVMDGYKYKNVISDTLIFEIPEITPDFAGRYSCSLVPPWGPPPDLCILHVKTDITRANNVKASGSSQTDWPISSPIVIILIVVIVLFAVLLVVQLLLFRRKRREQMSLFGTMLKETFEKSLKEAESRHLSSAKELEMLKGRNPPSSSIPADYEDVTCMGPSTSLYSEDDECATLTSSTKELEMFKEDDECATLTSSTKELEMFKRPSTSLYSRPFTSLYSALNPPAADHVDEETQM